MNHEVIEAILDELVGQWHVKAKDITTGNIKTTSAHVLINARGILNAWRYPPIKGIKDYKGTVVHSAAWLENLDLTRRSLA